MILQRTILCQRLSDKTKKSTEPFISRLVSAVLIEGGKK